MNLEARPPAELHDKSSDFYERNKLYYDRNARKYEAASWYFLNRYKNNAVDKELKWCQEIIPRTSTMKVFEIGPGTGYLLGKLLPILNSNIHYTGIEHSHAMIQILNERFSKKCTRFTVINDHVNAEQLGKMKHSGKYDFIMGSSILHHLLDYDEVIEACAEMLNDGGVMYFVREPIHKDECEKAGVMSHALEQTYRFINGLLLYPAVRNYLWPQKVKAEDASTIAYHMFKNGVSVKKFRELAHKNFTLIFMRKYNRRASSFLSYLENEWLKWSRKDVFGNTLFSICIRKVR